MSCQSQGVSKGLVLFVVKLSLKVSWVSLHLSNPCYLSLSVCHVSHRGVSQSLVYSRLSLKVSFQSGVSVYLSKFSLLTAIPPSVVSVRGISQSLVYSRLSLKVSFESGVSVYLSKFSLLTAIPQSVVSVRGISQSLVYSRLSLKVSFQSGVSVYLSKFTLLTAIPQSVVSFRGISQSLVYSRLSLKVSFLSKGIFHDLSRVFHSQALFMLIFVINPSVVLHP